MTAPELELTAAIEAGAEGISDSWHLVATRFELTSPLNQDACRKDAQAAIEAALPHIRGALARQVEAEPDESVPGYFSFRPAGLIRRSRAARIVRGES